MSFSVQALQALPESEPVEREAARLTNCRTHYGCTFDI